MQDPSDHDSDEPIAPASTREPGRRGKQGETRARLIAVTIELLRGEGMSAITTSRITKAAGIAQPGFYAHFKNVDDLVGTAVREVLIEMRKRIGDARRAAFGTMQRYEDVANFESMRSNMQHGLDSFLAEPRFAELFLRYRRDPALLGGLMRDALREMREDLTEDIWRTAKKFGFEQRHYTQVELWSDHLLGIYFTAAEALLDKRYEDRAAVIESATRSSFAVMVANVAAAGLYNLLPGRPRRRQQQGADAPQSTPSTPDTQGT